MPRMYLANITIIVSMHGHCTCVCMCVFMFDNNGGGVLLSSAARIWEPNPTVPVSVTISARCLDMGPSSDSENGPKCHLCLMMTSLSQALSSSYSKHDCRSSICIAWWLVRNQTSRPTPDSRIRTCILRRCPGDSCAR